VLRQQISGGGYDRPAAFSEIFLIEPAWTNALLHTGKYATAGFM
jgi:hypothetical protein